uniref:Uncharacterized protein n=1 Tax=Salix viminalis TaxID=40686 RepID=A0A6N2KLK9_SALVM
MTIAPWSSISTPGHEYMHQADLHLIYQRSLGRPSGNTGVSTFSISIIIIKIWGCIIIFIIPIVFIIIIKLVTTHVTINIRPIVSLIASIFLPRSSIFSTCPLCPWSTSPRESRNHNKRTKLLFDVQQPVLLHQMRIRICIPEEN